MTMNLTKGGLSPAKLVNLSTNEEVNFMFNPFEYTISKSNTWEKETAKGKNIPRHTFKEGGPQSLSLTLHFDTQKSGEDVRGITDSLWKMVMIDEQNVNQTTGKGIPPAVEFQWGRLFFRAIITTMSQKFTLFKNDGTPIRCQVSVTLEQSADESEFQPQTANQGVGQGAPEATTMVEGDRLDNVASSSGSDHRTVAANNNIDNPMNVPAGTQLNT